MSLDGREGESVPGQGREAVSGGDEVPELAEEELDVGGGRGVPRGPPGHMATAENHEERRALGGGPEGQEQPGLTPHRTLENQPYRDLTQPQNPGEPALQRPNPATKPWRTSLTET